MLSPEVAAEHRAAEMEIAACIYCLSSLPFLCYRHPGRWGELAVNILQLVICRNKSHCVFAAACVEGVWVSPAPPAPHGFYVVSSSWGFIVHLIQSFFLMCPSLQPQLLCISGKGLAAEGAGAEMQNSSYVTKTRSHCPALSLSIHLQSSI